MNNSDAINILLRNSQRKLFCLERNLDPNKPVEIVFASSGNVTKAAVYAIIDAWSNQQYLRDIKITLCGRNNKKSNNHRKMIRNQARERCQGLMNIQIMPLEYLIDHKNADVIFFTADTNSPTEKNRFKITQNNKPIIEKFEKYFSHQQGKIIGVSNLPEALFHYACKIWNLPDPVNQFLAGVLTDLGRAEVTIMDALALKDIHPGRLDLTLGGFHSQMWPVIGDINNPSNISNPKMITGIHMPFAGTPYEETKDISDLLHDLFPYNNLARELQRYPWEQAKQAMEAGEKGIPTIATTGYACQRLLKAIINEESTVVGTLQSINNNLPMFLNFNVSFKDGKIIFDQKRWDSLGQEDQKQIIDRVFINYDEREYGEGSFSSLKNILDRTLGDDLVLDLKREEKETQTPIIISHPLDNFNSLITSFMQVLSHSNSQKQGWQILDFNTIDNLFGVMHKINQTYESEKLSKFPDAEDKLTKIQERFNSTLSNQYSYLNKKTSQMLSSRRAGQEIQRKEFTSLLGLKDLFENLSEKFPETFNEQNNQSRLKLEKNTESLWQDLIYIQKQDFVKLDLPEGDSYTKFQELSILLNQSIKSAESHGDFLFQTITPEYVDQICSLYDEIRNLANKSEIKRDPEFPVLYQQINHKFQSLVRREEQILENVLDRVRKATEIGELTEKLRVEFHNAQIISQNWGSYIIGEEYWDGNRLSADQVYINIIK